MKVVQLLKLIPKPFQNPTPIRESAHLGPNKKITTPNLIQIQMVELKESYKMKVVQLHEQTPKQLSNPTQTPKVAHQGTKIKSKSNIRIEGNIENETWLTK